MNRHEEVLQLAVRTYSRLMFFFSQIAFFQQLIEQQPEIAGALNSQMAIIEVEIRRQQKFEALQVHPSSFSCNVITSLCVFKREMVARHGPG